jgi:DHA1 family tetracycline resistance protein-like MFS transporter
MVCHVQDEPERRILPCGLWYSMKHSSEMTSPSERNPTSIYPILAVNFVGTLGFAIVLPFLVFLVTRLGGNALVYGAMGATYSFFQLIGAPILGRWSDRVGRQRILLLSQLGTLIAWGIFLVALYLPVTNLAEIDSGMLGTFTLTVPLVVLFFARALDGLTGGNVSVANAYLADITDETDRSTNFGKMAISANLGFIVGPAIAGLLGATVLGETLPVMAAFAISGVATLLIIFKLPPSQPCQIESSPEEPTVRQVLGQEQKECYVLKNSDKISLMEVFKLPSLPLLLGVHFFVFLSFNLFYVSFPVHAVTGLGWSLAETGLFFAVMGLLMVTVQGPVLKALSSKISDRLLVLWGSLILAVGFVVFLSENVALIYVATALMALGNGVMWPSLLAVISRASSSEMQGTVQGFASSGGSIASITGLLLGGFLFDSIGERVFLLAAGFALAAFLMSFAIKPR